MADRINRSYLDTVERVLRVTRFDACRAVQRAVVTVVATIRRGVSTRDVFSALWAGRACEVPATFEPQQLVEVLLPLVPPD